ncbi:MAG: VWA domain-containing protein, partial [Deltaproteobacteria bacterium]|nr:VWA domain-containing protein [Deltaproteobacteria bacterium]
MPPKTVPVQRPQVDVVFVVDTTGSMSSLISGAKKKIWELARYIAQGQPAPELRVGLVAYRDVGDEYVTKFFDLTDDIDGVYQNLTSFAAGGGGDTPEHVAKALHDAVYRSSWGPGKNTLKMVYLVGDAPPHSDYQDGFDFRTIAREARSRGIRINTVRCGSDEDTRASFTEIASLTGGDFSTIDQSGGMTDVKTPFDEELARLNRALTETAIPWGDAERRTSIRRKAESNLAAPAEAQAARAGYFGLAKARGRTAAVSDGDLLEDVANNKVRLE